MGVMQKGINIEPNTFGSRLHGLILQKYGSRYKFSMVTGLSRETLLNYCENKRNPTAPMLANMCKLLGCSADYLLFGTEEYELVFESHTGNKVGNWHCGNCNGILIPKDTQKYCPYCGKKIKEVKRK